MAPLDASAVARLLNEFARRSALRGGNPYRAHAYSRAAESLATLTLPLEDLIRQERLRDIPGVGDAIADIITKLHTTGTHPSLDAMRQEVPAGVLDFLTIPGVRPDKALKLYNQLGVTTLAALEEAACHSRGQRGVSLSPPTADFRRASASPLADVLETESRSGYYNQC